MRGNSSVRLHCIKALWTAMLLADVLFNLNKDFSASCLWQEMWITVLEMLKYCVRSTEQVGHYICTTLGSDIE